MITHETLIIASGDGHVQAIDARDGSLRWTLDCDHPFGGSALVQTGDMVIAAALDGYLCAVAIADGTVRWQGSLAREAPATSEARQASVSFGLRVAANGDRCAVQFGNRIFGVDTTDGHVTWETAPTFHPATKWWLLAMGQDHVYLLQLEGGSERAFVTAAFSNWDAAPQWFAHDLSAVEPPWDGASSLVEVDSVVYIYGRQGLHALEATSGKLQWTCDSMPQYHIGALAVGQNQIVVAAKGHFGAYRRDTGALLWSLSGEQRTDGFFEIFDNPLVISDKVYIGHRRSTPEEGNFHVEAYRCETGALGWEWPETSTSSTSLHPDISWRFRGAGSMLYVPSLDTLSGIHAIDGNERWRLPYRLGFDALLAVAGEEHESSEA